MSAAVLWFRRDLRLDDHPALMAAADKGPVSALFVLDDELRKPSGSPRIAFMYRTLRALDERLREHGGGLLVRRG
jgi:deoxyribodipyrimidine photo-lyase